MDAAQLNTTPAQETRPIPEAQRLRDLSSQQWKSGIAAWLGWLFDGLDMHLYTLVATAFVANNCGQPARRAEPAVVCRNLRRFIARS